jgi:hypothetical protein
MATVEQITSNSSPVGTAIERFVGDDWTLPFEFTDDNGAALDMSAYTFTAFLIYETVTYTSTALTSTNGAVDSSQASSGIITATVYDALTSTLTADKDSVDTAGVLANTRLALVQTSGTSIETVAIIPIKVIRR